MSGLWRLSLLAVLLGPYSTQGWAPCLFWGASCSARQAMVSCSSASNVGGDGITGGEVGREAWAGLLRSQEWLRQGKLVERGFVVQESGQLFPFPSHSVDVMTKLTVGELKKDCRTAGLAVSGKKK